MSPLFPRWTNIMLPALILLGPPGAITGATLGIWYYASPEFTDVGYAPDQPVAYSHKLHAGELGIDCRYCHNTVEIGKRAAVPPVDTCMNCHKVVRTDSELLAPVREAAADPDVSLAWARVHIFPDYAYFDHSVHVAAAVGCVTCHGRVDQMVTVTQQEPLSMGWCLKCHSEPAANLRPTSEVTNMGWVPADSPDYDPLNADRFPTPPQHCSGCHR